MSPPPTLAHRAPKTKQPRKVKVTAEEQAAKRNGTPMPPVDLAWFAREESESERAATQSRPAERRGLPEAPPASTHSRPAASSSDREAADLGFLELHGEGHLDEPEIAGELGRMKAEAIRSTGASVVAAGNIGCLVQIKTHLESGPTPIRVAHTFELLAEAYREDG